MDVSNVSETTLPSDSPETFTAVQNTRRPYEKRLAVHLILATILFAHAALYCLDNNVGSSIYSNKALNWTQQHSSLTEDIFDGK